MAAILIPCCFADALRSHLLTMGVTIFGWFVWMLFGLMFTFVNV